MRAPPGGRVRGRISDGEEGSASGNRTCRKRVPPVVCLHALAQQTVCLGMKSMTACLVIASSFASVVLAQEKPVSTFRLRFRMHESGAQAEETTRNYVLLLQSESRGKVNASRRLPHSTSSKGEAKELHTIALGTIIECTVEDAEAGVSLDCAFESSYVAPEQPVEQPPIGFLPIMNSRQVSTTAVIPIGPEVQVARLDDPSSGNRLEIFVSAERFAGPIAAANLETR